MKHAFTIPPKKRREDETREASKPPTPHNNMCRLLLLRCTRQASFYYALKEKEEKAREERPTSHTHPIKISAGSSCFAALCKQASGICVYGVCVRGLLLASLVSSSLLFFEGIVKDCLPSTSKQEEPADICMMCVCVWLACFSSLVFSFFLWGYRESLSA